MKKTIVYYQNLNDKFYFWLEIYDNSNNKDDGGDLRDNDDDTLCNEPARRILRGENERPLGCKCTCRWTGKLCNLVYRW